jgi:hypothetical protein
MDKKRVLYVLLLPLAMVAQTSRDVAPLKNWTAPPYWQPTAEERSLATKPEPSGNAAEAIPLAQTPANSLVFVGMTPCRLVDTRSAAGFTGAFGPPSLVANATRSFPLQASTTCSVPSIAQAYSLNVTVVPPGYLGFLTIWPYGAARPSASTLNDYLGTVVANAAIVPAGNDTSGSVDVFVNDPTDLIIDINGYYAPESGITLTQGTAAAPSLSFAGDPGTGIYSSGTGTVNIATGGTNSVTVAPNGNVGIGTATPAAKLEVDGNAQVDGTLTMDGLITFAAGQTFPGSGGSGTVTSVSAGTGLTASPNPITSSGTLSIATGGVTNAMLANPSLTVTAGADLTGGGTVVLGGSTTLNLDTTKVPQLNSANTFSGNQTVNGNLGVTGAATITGTGSFIASTGSAQLIVNSGGYGTTTTGAIAGNSSTTSGTGGLYLASSNAVFAGNNTGLMFVGPNSGQWEQGPSSTGGPTNFMSIAMNSTTTAAQNISFNTPTGVPVQTGRYGGSSTNTLDDGNNNMTVLGWIWQKGRNYLQSNPSNPTSASSTSFTMT